MSERHNDGGPAFPSGPIPMSLDGGDAVGFTPGMSLWDYYAGKALAGILANPAVGGANGVAYGGKVLVTLAADYADAMVAESARRIGGQADG